MEPTRVHIRWMIRRDMAEVMAVAASAHREPMSEEDTLSILRQRNAIGMVCEIGETIPGFMIYELLDGRIRIVEMAVHRNHQRRSIGSQMVAKLIGKLSPGRRVEITVNVPEEYLGSQLFLKKHGFRAIEIQEDTYHMVYRI